MKKTNAIFFFFALSLLMISCQKEISSEITQRVNGNGLVAKIVSIYTVDNFDYYTEEFEYDTADRLWVVTNTLKIKQANGSITVNKRANQFFRDNIGRVERVGAMPDTSSWAILITYENSTSLKIINTRLTHQIGSVITVLDSSVFDYDANGRIIKRSSYGGTPGPLTGYQAYQYDTRGNLILHQQFLRNAAGGFDLNIAYGFEYDDKISPTYFPEISMANYNPGWPLFLSPDNVVKQINYPYTGFVDSHGYSYQYDSDGRPASMLRNYDPGNGVLVQDSTNLTRYFYN